MKESELARKLIFAELILSQKLSGGLISESILLSSASSDLANSESMNTCM
jgi:hypothetical protein